MSESLLSICQAVAEEILFDAPQSIVGNLDSDAILLKRFVTQTCRELVRDYTWQALKRTHTFSTEDGTAAYDLPSDYSSPISLSFWDRTSQMPMAAASAIEWQKLQSGVNISGIRYRFVVEANQLKLFPVPASVVTIAFNYYSNAFAESDEGVAKSDFSADSDVCRLDGDMVIRGVKYRFAHRKGLPYAEYKADYNAAVDALQGNDTPKQMFDFSNRCKAQSNIPESNFGS